MLTNAPCLATAKMAVSLVLLHYFVLFLAADFLQCGTEMTAVTYSFKPNVFSPLWECTATPDGLMLKGSPPHTLIRWSDICGLRLSYEPSRFDYDRYFCRLLRNNGAPVVLGSTTCEGVGKFVLQAREYRAMVQEIHVRLQKQGHPVRYISGVGQLRYFCNVVILLLSLVTLVAIFLIVGTAYLGAWVIVKLIILAAALPWAWQWIRKNRPRSYDPATVPAALLPKAPTHTDKVVQPPPLPMG